MKPRPILDQLSTYKVYGGTSPNNMDLLATLGSASSYDATNLTNGTTYYFAVEAVDAAENSSGRTVRGLCDPCGQRRSRDAYGTPGIPSEIGLVTLSWDTVQADDLSTYRIQYSSEPDVWTTITGVLPGAETGSVVPGLTNGTQYKFRVAAVDDADNASSYTDPVLATPSATP